MKIGFTGTRVGMSNRQLGLLLAKLQAYQPTEAHHGDCVGADSEFHLLCRALNIPLVLHPPEKGSQRAYCKGSSVILNPKPFLVRNREIVEVSDVMLAAPACEDEVMRSGTWATIRYTKKRQKTLHILTP